MTSMIAALSKSNINPSQYPDARIELFGSKDKEVYLPRPKQPTQTWATRPNRNYVPLQERLLCTICGQTDHTDRYCQFRDKKPKR